MSEQFPSEIPNGAFIEPYIVFENGRAVKKVRLVLNKEDVQSMKYHAAAQPYLGKWMDDEKTYDADPRFKGMTKIEVAMHKQMDAAVNGDLSALRDIEDRILGKPKMQMETVQISATLEDFLERVGEKEGILSPSSDCFSGDIIEGEVVGSSPSGDLLDLDI